MGNGLFLKGAKYPVNISKYRLERWMAREIWVKNAINKESFSGWQEEVRGNLWLYIVSVRAQTRTVI